MSTDPFALLGVSRRFRIDRRELEQKHRDLSRALHPDRFAQATAAERRVAIERAAAVNAAFRTLRDPQTRAAALLAGAGRALEEHTRAEPALLLEVMELREELDDARTAPAERRTSRIDAVRARAQECLEREHGVLAAVFDGEGAPDEAALDRAYGALVKLRYYHRLFEEADALSEEEV